MRRLMALGMAFWWCGSAWADQTPRIKDLEQELTAISAAIQRHQSEIQVLIQRSLMHQGAIEELKRQDAQATPTEAPRVPS